VRDRTAGLPQGLLCLVQEALATMVETEVRDRLELS